MLTGVLTVAQGYGDKDMQGMFLMRTWQLARLLSLPLHLAQASRSRRPLLSARVGRGARTRTGGPTASTSGAAWHVAGRGGGGSAAETYARAGSGGARAVAAHAAPSGA